MNIFFKILTTIVAPAINCPGDIRRESTGDVVVSFPVATAYDSSNNQLTVFYTYSTNVQNMFDDGTNVRATFPTGTTTVTIISEDDGFGRFAVCQFDVIGKRILSQYNYVSENLPHKVKTQYLYF